MKCRICKNNLEHKILLLSNMPLTDEFISVKEDHNEYIKDINIYQCDACGIVQNPDDFDYSSYYQNYEYTSGNSFFTQQFMEKYAKFAIDEFKKINEKSPSSILEIGSGDGQQLIQFKKLGLKKLTGVEPSKSLCEISNEFGIKTIQGLFNNVLKNSVKESFDICISSYTFDHVRDPIDYLETAHFLLNKNGILAIEIHDFATIKKRNEFCLFEHEHTIYLTEENIRFILNRSGFDVTSINPIDTKFTRANSLIVFAKKVDSKNHDNSNDLMKSKDFDNKAIQQKVNNTIKKIEDWVDQCPDGVVGYGAGGRGIMTSAALSNYKKFHALFDSNFKDKQFLAPKTRIPILPPTLLKDYKNLPCLIFSFGYFNEIKEDLINNGFDINNIFSLEQFYEC